MWLLRLLVCFILLVGCSNATAIPGDVIPKEKMQGLLWDMLQADRFATQHLNDSLKRELDTQRFTLYHQVFALHDVTKDQFIKSFNFYLSRPDITKGIFDSLAVEASRLRPTLYQESPK